MSEQSEQSKQQEAWEQAAYGAGREAAEAAASWVTDGNQESSARLALLRQLSEGDPSAEESLPREPNLSGEYADAPTPARLFESVTGLDAHAESTWNQEAYSELLEALCERWEAGVSERFQEACEAALLAAEGLSGLTASELAREYRERQERYAEQEGSSSAGSLLQPSQEAELRQLGQLWQSALSLEEAPVTPGAEQLYGRQLAQGLSLAVAAYREAAEGSSGDAEAEAAGRLADLAERAAAELGREGEGK